MSEGDKLTLTIHGLDVYNRDVDGEVFARKFFKFMQGLSEADKAANGKRRHKFLISDLEKHSAMAGVREQVSVDSTPAESGISFFDDGLSAIYEDAPRARRLPRAFVRNIVEINKGIGTDFVRGEIKRESTGKVVLIDEFLEARARRVLDDINRATAGTLPLYKGIVHGAFDGVLGVLDSRESTDRAVLVLTAGGKHIECILTNVPEDTVREAWKRRCVVSGVAHYDGESGLPERIDVHSIEPINLSARPFTEWRGAFEVPTLDDENWN